MPPELEGRCFRCLRDDHTKAACSFPERCYNCRSEGHKAMACPFPLASVPRAKRRQPASSSPVRQRRVLQRLPRGGRSRASVDTVSAGSPPRGIAASCIGSRVAVVAGRPRTRCRPGRPQLAVRHRRQSILPRRLSPRRLLPLLLHLGNRGLRIPSSTPRTRSLTSSGSGPCCAPRRRIGRSVRLSSCRAPSTSRPWRTLWSALSRRQ